MGLLPHLFAASLLCKGDEGEGLVTEWVLFESSLNVLRMEPSERDRRPFFDVTADIRRNHFLHEPYISIPCDNAGMRCWFADLVICWVSRPVLDGSYLERLSSE